MNSLEKNFCSSMAETVVIPTNVAHVRFYVEPKAMNSTFEAVMTAVRDKDSGEKCECCLFLSSVSRTQLAESSF